MKPIFICITIGLYIGCLACERAAVKEAEVLRNDSLPAHTVLPVPAGCIDSIALSDLLLFIDQQYNVYDTLESPMENVDTSRSSEGFFFTCNYFSSASVRQAVVVLPKFYTRLAVVEGGFMLFLVDYQNGRFAIRHQMAVNYMSQESIKDLTGDGIMEIIQQGSERKNDFCTESYAIFNLKGNETHYLFDANGTYYCQGELPSLAEMQYEQGALMSEPIEVMLTDKNRDGVYEVRLTQTQLFYNGGESDEEILQKAISKSTVKEIILNGE